MDSGHRQSEKGKAERACPSDILLGFLASVLPNFQGHIDLPGPYIQSFPIQFWAEKRQS